MHVTHAEGRDAFLATTAGFCAAVGELDDGDLLAATYCRGWAVIDVVVHVRLGLDELAVGLLCAGNATDPPDRDAATYWDAFPPGGDDDLDGLLAVRRTASATRRPSSALLPLRTTSSALARAVDRLDDGVLAFQGVTLTTGDFLATWAVELAVHQLDLCRELDLALPHRSGLTLARQTIEARNGVPLDRGAEAAAVLRGWGRRPR